MSKSKPEEKKQEEKTHDDEHVEGVKAITILTPDAGITLTSPFNITGGSPCDYVVITVFDSNTVFVPPTTVAATNGFYSYTFNQPNAHSSNATITVTCATDATKSCSLPGVIIASSTMLSFGNRPINGSLTLTLDVYSDGEVKKLKCNVINKYANANDFFFAKFTQCSIDTNPPKKTKVALKAVEHVNPHGDDVLTDRIVKKDDIYIVQVVYSDDNDVFCSYTGKIFV